MSKWKLSIGTAGAVGLRKLKTNALPTTAYIMLGEKCTRNCAFCAQARESTAAAKFLSRVVWQEVPEDNAIESIKDAYIKGKIQRACLQVVNRPDSLSVVKNAIEELTKAKVPVVVSGYITSVEEAGELLNLGADRLGIAMDVATPELFTKIKGGSWEKRWNLISSCARAYPGKITTHLIVGLGETEKEMFETIKLCYKEGITVGLFAFTPLKGTAMEKSNPPDIKRYRRLQIALGLLKKGIKAENIICDDEEIIRCDASNAQELLSDGDCFRTSGCDNCNRPFYNERPGQILYDYPWKLSEEEVEEALKMSEVEFC